MSDVITIDGPASAGKNSVGFLLSQKLGYQFVDTGGIYRAGCIKILGAGVDLTNEQALAEVFKTLKIQFIVEDGKEVVYLDGQNVTARLHDPEITQIVPIIASFQKVRDVSKSLQREIGNQKDTVMIGRDIGTEIFPESKNKFFLTASPEIRAKRRFEQLRQKDPELTFIKVYTDMMDRDEKDSQREVSPMRIPDGAIVIDNSTKDINETVAEIIKNLA